jgi:hypothetical protein
VHSLTGPSNKTDFFFKDHSTTQKNDAEHPGIFTAFNFIIQYLFKVSGTDNNFVVKTEVLLESFLVVTPGNVRCYY